MIKRIIKNLEAFITATSLALMLIVVIADVFSRLLFSKSFGFTEEIAYISFTYCVFFGAAYLYKSQALIAIDFVIEKLPKGLKRIAYISNFSLLIVANLYFAYLSAILTIDGWERPTAFLSIPYTFIYLAAFFAFVIMLIYSIKFLIEAIRGKDSIVSVSPENQF